MLYPGGFSNIANTKLLLPGGRYELGGFKKYAPNSETSVNNETIAIRVTCLAGILEMIQ